MEARSEGVTGHNEHWVESIYAIERSVIFELGWKTDVGIEGSVNYEVRETGWKPTEDQLRRWCDVLDGGNKAKYMKTPSQSIEKQLQVV
jgi:hypothetical protein